MPLFWGCCCCREEEGKESMEEAIQKAADELVEKFEEGWKPAMENLQEADAAFDKLEGWSFSYLHLLLPLQAHLHHFPAPSLLYMWLLAFPN